MRTLTEPFWLIDNIDVRTWYYRDAPAVGSIVRYTNESFIDTVSHVTAVGIWFESGHMMRRPYLAGRLIGWITATIQDRNRRSTYIAAPRRSNSFITSTVQLRPDMTLAV